MNKQDIRAYIDAKNDGARQFLQPNHIPRKSSPLVNVSAEVQALIDF